jgi:hypothetical protein
VTTKEGPPPTETTPPTESTPPSKAPPTVPVAKRRNLASTGLSPWLIAMFGGTLLAGGGLLFRRALARD